MDVKEGEGVVGRKERRRTQVSLRCSVISTCWPNEWGPRMAVRHVLRSGIAVLPNGVRAGLPKAGASEHEHE